jgi:hypothetical protein
MKFDITDHRKIHEIEKEFSDLFPYLKLNFFGKPHSAKGATPKKIPVNSNKTIGECRIIHTKGILTITPNMTVADLEREFADTYGLTVRVFFKSGANWLETSSDMWSLKKHNDIASELNLEAKPEVL